MGLDGLEVKKVQKKESQQALLQLKNDVKKIDDKKRDGQAKKAKKQHQNSQQRHASVDYGHQLNTRKLNCAGCNSRKSMHKGTIHRFGEHLRGVGWLCSILALFGLLISLILFFFWVSGREDFEFMAALIFSTMFFLSSISLGAIGLLLLSHRKVYHCDNCGYSLDRSDVLATQAKSPFSLY